MHYPARRTPTRFAPAARLAAGGVLLSALAAAGPPAGAVQPQRFEHTTEKDFADGEVDGAVVTNLGDLKLATAARSLGALPEDTSFVYDLATVGGTACAAVGPEGRVLAWDGGEWTEVAAFEGGQVFALLVRGDTLLAAVSGADAGVHALDVAGGGDVELLAALPQDVRYVWDLVAVGDRLAAATGPEGKVFSIGADGAVDQMLDTAQANVLSLAAGRGPMAGQVFAGTDTDGLVYRIDAQGQAFVVYDAPEPEVSALAIAADGTLYAGTADAEQATPGRLEDPVEDENGRPETAPDSESEDDAETPGAEAPDTEPRADTASDAVSEERAEPADANTDTDTDTDADQAPAPDYDALRAEVRRRIAAAAAGRADASPRRAAGPAPTRRAREGARGGDNTKGNAVYRVDPRGFVSEVFRESVMVLSLALTDDDHTLLVATGNEGQLLRLNPGAGETAVLTEFEGRQLLALAADADGGVTVGAANPAGVHRLTGGHADEGVYTSAALDAQQVSLWGTARIAARLPAGSTLAFATRSGNVQDPEIAGGAGWSEWSAPQTLTPAGGGFAPLEAVVDAPPARFLQYRVTLSGPGGADANAPAPAVTGLSIAYVTPNLRPRLQELKAAYPDFPGVDKPASPTLTVEWEAQDPNDDRLVYTLEQRPAAQQPADTPWLTLVESTDDTSFDWDTRRVPDGYHELRVRAHDRPDNPGGMALTAARRSDPVLVDNTPPALESLDIAVRGHAAAVTAVVADTHSPIHSVAYRLDDAQDESPLLPDDLIYDSTREAWSIKLSDLSPGPHLLSVRVTDARGNRSFHARRFDVAAE